jgi:hypothetical protein
LLQTTVTILPEFQQKALCNGIYINMLGIIIKWLKNKNLCESVSRMHLHYSSFSVPPMIWIQNQLVGAHEGQQMTLDCHSEAFPKSINYWTREKGEIIAQGNSLHI